MILNDNHEHSHKFDTLTQLESLGCDVIGLHETRRSRQSISKPGVHSVFYSSREDGNSRHDVGLAIKGLIVCGSTWKQG